MTPKEIELKKENKELKKENKKLKKEVERYTVTSTISANQFLKCFEINPGDY